MHIKLYWVHVKYQDDNRCTHLILGTNLGMGCGRSGGQKIWLREMREALNLWEVWLNMRSLSWACSYCVRDHIGQGNCSQQKTEHHLKNYPNTFITKLAEAESVSPPKEGQGLGLQRAARVKSSWEIMQVLLSPHGQVGIGLYRDG